MPQLDTDNSFASITDRSQPVSPIGTHLVQLIDHGVDCSLVARHTVDALVLKSLLFHDPRADLHNQRHQLDTSAHLITLTDIPTNTDSITDVSHYRVPEHTHTQSFNGLFPGLPG